MRGRAGYDCLAPAVAKPFAGRKEASMRNGLLLILMASFAATHALAQRTAAPAVAAPPAAPAPAPSQVLQSWRSGDGWLTELRRHPDGTTSCATAKSFAERGFGLFMLRSGNVTLFAIVDQRQPFTGPGTLKLVQGARAIGTFDAQAQGPALSSVEILSRQVKAAIDKLDTGVLDVDAAGRHFAADMTGIDRARAQLASCVIEMDLAKPGK
jgi:cytochrome c peroxidase